MGQAAGFPTAGQRPAHHHFSAVPAVPAAAANAGSAGLDKPCALQWQPTAQQHFHHQQQAYHAMQQHQALLGMQSQHAGAPQPPRTTSADTRSVQSAAASKVLDDTPRPALRTEQAEHIALPRDPTVLLAPAAARRGVDSEYVSLPVPAAVCAAQAPAVAATTTAQPTQEHVLATTAMPNPALSIEPDTVSSAAGLKQAAEPPATAAAAAEAGCPSSAAAPATAAAAAEAGCPSSAGGGTASTEARQSASMASFETPGGARGQAWKVSAVKRQSDQDDSTVASSETGASGASRPPRIPSILRQIGASHLPMIHGCFGLPLDEQCRATQPALLATADAPLLMRRLAALCSPPTVRIFCNEAHLKLDKNWKRPELLSPRLRHHEWRGKGFVPDSFVHPSLAHNELLAADIAVEMVTRIIMHRAGRLHKAWSAEDAARAETAALLGTAPPPADPSRSMAAAVHVMLCRVIGAMQHGLQLWPTDLQRFNPGHLLLQGGSPRGADARFVALAVEVPVRLHWASSTLHAPLPEPGQLGAIPFPCLQAVTFGMSRLNKGGPEVPTPLPTFLDVFDETDHSVPDYTTSSIDPMLNTLASRFACAFESAPLTMSLHKAPPVPDSIKQALQSSITQSRCTPERRETSTEDQSGVGELSPTGTSSTLGPSASQVGVTYVNEGRQPGTARSSKDPVEHSQAASQIDNPEGDTVLRDSASAVAAGSSLMKRSGVSYLQFPAPGTQVLMTAELRQRVRPVWLRASALLPAERFCPHIPHLLPERKGRAVAKLGGAKRPRGSDQTGANGAPSDLPDSETASGASEAYSELELSCIPANYLFGRIVLSIALMDAVQVLL